MPVRERSKVQALPRLASHQVVSHRAAARVRRAHLGDWLAPNITDDPIILELR